MRCRGASRAVTVTAAGAFVVALCPPARAGEPAYDRPDIEVPDDGMIPEPEPEPEGSSATTEIEPEGPPAPEPRPRTKPNGLMIGGYVTAGLAVASLAPLIAGVAMAAQGAQDYPDGRTREQELDDRRKIRNGNRIAAAGGIAAGGLGVTAIILVAVGKKRRDEQRLSVVPTGSRQGAGLVFAGRF